MISCVSAMPSGDYEVLIVEQFLALVGQATTKTASRDWLPIALSALAAVLASVALWRTHFAAFNPVVAPGLLRWTLTPIRNGPDKWYIVSFMIPVAIANSGARPGVILGMRVKLHFPKVGPRNNRTLLQARFCVDASGVRDTTAARFKWLENYATDWLPFVVLPRETVFQHILFETRWDILVVVQEEAMATLEIYSDRRLRRKWRAVACWRVNLSPSTVSLLLSSKSMIGVGTMPLGSPTTEATTVPSDLLKIVSSPEPLPAHEAHEPSVLDYPDSTDDVID